LLRGDNGWGNEGVMREAEQRALPYLFRLRLTANIQRAIEKAMDGAWEPAGQGWEGQAIQLRLNGWGRQRRVVLLHRKLDGTPAISEPDANGLRRLGFAAIDDRQKVWEFSALVTSLGSEILTLGQLYRDRGDCENDFDELKNQWGGAVLPHATRVVARSWPVAWRWCSMGGTCSSAWLIRTSSARRLPVGPCC
jgi:hypothetical protein